MEVNVNNIFTCSDVFNVTMHPVYKNRFINIVKLRGHFLFNAEILKHFQKLVILVYVDLIQRN